ncbi:c-type cytochrome [uncultured Meiothermus sp.]|jgi:mono/diheme cytochrome c family protein|uniref:c-type cytochrome n=1 Tax=uncultured Meiothermus sp. TaxID=157471 RepID=UPI0026120F49|nr:c-type cytochrome [uncultured Meiothermus sp.]
MKRVLVGLAALAGLVVAADGAQLFRQTCAGCHGATGQGIPGVFVPLADNPRVQDEAYVVRVIQEGIRGPLEVNGRIYQGVMPAMPHLTEADARAIAAHVRGLGEVGVPAPPPQPIPEPIPAEQADPALIARGQALFLGQQRLANGGAPCMACHTAGDFGLMGGGSLGRDLTDLHLRLGAAGVRGMLTNLAAFPVMRESYQDKPLTPEEISALGAYFAHTAGPPTSIAQRDTARMLFAGLIGLVVLFGVMYLFWKNRPVGLAERIRTTGRRST